MQKGTKKHKRRHDLVRKVIHRESCKRLKFGLADKWYMLKPKSFKEKKMPKILWDFEIQIDHQTSAIRPDIILVNKKKINWSSLKFRRFRKMK